MPVRIFNIMNITQLSCGERAVVVAVECPAALKERLRSLNIRPGATLSLVKISFFKKTYLIKAGGSSIVVRREIAECVKIRKA